MSSYWKSSNHHWAIALSLCLIFVAVGCDSQFQGTAPETQDLSLNADDIAETPAVLTTPGGNYERGKLIRMLFRGPYACDDFQGNSNSAEPNPFKHYQCFAKITHRTVPGYQLNLPIFFNGHVNVADDNPTNDPMVPTASCGYMWEARFRPELPGTYDWSAECERGQNIGLDPYGTGPGGVDVRPDGESGTVDVAESSYPGLYEVTEEGYTNYFNDAFLKTGHDSPENFFGYFEFDQTYHEFDASQVTYTLGFDAHNYPTHDDHYVGGGETWQGGKGEFIFGAIDYMTSQGMNSQYIIMYTIGLHGDGSNAVGDSNDTWPNQCNPNHDAACLNVFDVSKLEQWNRVMNYMTKRGMMIHLVFNEDENDFVHGFLVNNQTEITDERKVYYKEIIARFSHHPNLVFNISEEWRPKSNLSESLLIAKKALDYIAAMDPYRHPRGTHTFPNDWDDILLPLMTHPTATLASIQNNTQNGNMFNSRVQALANAADHPVLIAAGKN